MAIFAQDLLSVRDLNISLPELTRRREALEVAVPPGAPGQDRAPDLARELTIRMSALSQGADYARAITAGGGTADVGDAPLWELLRPALRRTGRTLTTSLSTA